MKRIQFLLAALALSFSLSLGFVGVVAADDSSTTTQSSDTTDSSTPDEINSRVKERENELHITLSEIEKVRLRARCHAGQGLVNGLLNKEHNLETNRVRVYDDITDRLNTLVQKLQAKGADTTTLEANIAEYQTKVSTFKTDLADYKQALQDLRDMDCTSDPAGFKATLEKARQIRESMKQDAKGIREYVVTTIKKTLKEIRDIISANDSQSTDNSGGEL